MQVNAIGIGKKKLLTNHSWEEFRWPIFSVENINMHQMKCKWVVLDDSKQAQELNYCDFFSGGKDWTLWGLPDPENELNKDQRVT